MTTIQSRDDLTTADAEIDQRAPESDDADRTETTTDPPEAAAPAEKPKRTRRARKVAAAEAVVRGHANGHAGAQVNGAEPVARARGLLADGSEPTNYSELLMSRVEGLKTDLREQIVVLREAAEQYRGSASKVEHDADVLEGHLKALGGVSDEAAAEAPAARKAGKPARAAASKPSSARMPRRSAEDIDAGVQRVVDHLKKHADGLRAEQIKADLGIDRKELPKLLKTAIAEKLIRSRGAKRSTTYTAR